LRAVLRRLLLLLILAFVFFQAGLAAYSDPDYDSVIYKGDFFVLLEPAGPLEPEVYDENAAIRLLLEEASYVFSAMIYGFEFVYIPMDVARAVSEEFTLTPVHSIKWGDPALTVVGGRYKEGRYDAELRYAVSEAQIPWIRSWETNILPAVSAVGMGDLNKGKEGKIQAIENTVKEAVRNYLRPRIYDKPRRISGRARLAAVPYITMDSGKFIAKARITLQIEEVLEYNAF